jgi:hypothetical protein
MFELGVTTVHLNEAYATIVTFVGAGLWALISIPAAILILTSFFILKTQGFVLPFWVWALTLVQSATGSAMVSASSIKLERFKKGDKHFAVQDVGSAFLKFGSWLLVTAVTYLIAIMFNWVQFS